MKKNRLDITNSMLRLTVGDGHVRPETIGGDKMKMISIMALVIMLVLLGSVFVQAQEEAIVVEPEVEVMEELTPPAPKVKIIKEMLIHVQSNIIAMPGNQAARVPIGAARVRSTDLRDINEEYNVVAIEKLFEIEKKSIRSNDLKGKEVKNKELSLQAVFTKEKKKELKKQGLEIVEVNDAFLLQFEFDSEPSMSAIVNAYRDVSVVLNAEHVVRTE